jgi:carboxymethylenebutenolidase
MPAMLRSALALVVVAFAACNNPSSTPSTAAPAPSSPPAPSSSAASAPASATAQARAGQAVTLPRDAWGYLALPSGAGKHPALLVIQEWWGLNDWIRDDADRFAGQGYVALAVDLYRGHTATSPDEAHELMRGLPEDRAIGDMETAFQWLAARPDVDPAKIGAIGWCMGGGYALSFAVAEPKLRAVSVNYGRLVSDNAKVAKIQAAFLGSFAGQDRGIPPADVRAFEKQLKTTDKDVDIKIYDSAGHAFMNPNNKGGYDEGAAKDAWGRIDAFFARTLGK